MKRKIISLLFLIICFNGWSAEKININKILQQKQITKLYAVNSFEGLRVRNAPSLDAEKIGLLEYQETVNVLLIDNKDVVIDGITSKWYKIKSEKYEGYVFGVILLQSVALENLLKKEIIILILIK